MSHAAAVSTPEWRALADALADHGPAPCESLDPETWWAAPVAEQQDAREACSWCPVLSECRAYALAAGEREGVWGGLTAAERGRLLR